MTRDKIIMLPSDLVTLVSYSARKSVSRNTSFWAPSLAGKVPKLFFLKFCIRQISTFSAVFMTQLPGSQGK